MSRTVGGSARVILGVMTAALFLALGLAGCSDENNPFGGGGKSRTVTFNANGGSGAPSAITAGEGSEITLPSGSGMTRSGYTFSGWNTNSSGTGTNYSAGASYTVSGNVTLYAKWSASSSTPTTTGSVTLSFSCGGRGGGGTTMTADPRATVRLPTNGTCNSYVNGGKTFAGWRSSGVTYSGGATYTVPANAAKGSTISFEAIWL